MPLELNLIALDPAKREARLLEEFGALAAGQSLVLRTDGSPEPLLTLLQDRARDQFEWHPLENRGRGWRTQLTRREEGEPHGRRLQEFMSTDHSRLRDLADALVGAARQGDAGEVARSHRHLATGLLRHLHMEEQVVFPVLLVKLGHPGGPASVLLAQHGRLRQLLDDVGQHLDGQPDDHRLVPLVSELVDSLDNHQSTEDRVLYGLTDLVLTDAERDALIQKCQQVVPAP